MYTATGTNQLRILKGLLYFHSQEAKGIKGQALIEATVLQIPQYYALHSTTKRTVLQKAQYCMGPWHEEDARSYITHSGLRPLIAKHA